MKAAADNGTANAAAQNIARNMVFLMSMRPEAACCWPARRRDALLRPETGRAGTVCRTENRHFALFCASAGVDAPMRVVRLLRISIASGAL